MPPHRIDSSTRQTTEGDINLIGCYPIHFNGKISVLTVVEHQSHFRYVLPLYLRGVQPTPSPIRPEGREREGNLHPFTLCCGELGPI